MREEWGGRGGGGRGGRGEKGGREEGKVISTHLNCAVIIDCIIIVCSWSILWLQEEI